MGQSETKTNMVRAEVVTTRKKLGRRPGPKGIRVQVVFNDDHPIEGAILKAYLSGKWLKDGRDYVRGVDVIRRAAVLGWSQLGKSDEERAAQAVESTTPPAALIPRKGAAAAKAMRPKKDTSAILDEDNAEEPA